MNPPSSPYTGIQSRGVEVESRDSMLRTCACCRMYLQISYQDVNIGTNLALHRAGPITEISVYACSGAGFQY